MTGYPFYYALPCAYCSCKHLWAHDTGTGLDNKQTKARVGTIPKTAALALIL